MERPADSAFGVSFTLPIRATRHRPRSLILFSSGFVRVLPSVALFVLLFAPMLVAAEQRPDDCSAPDSKHYVVLIQSGEEAQGYQLEIRSVDMDKPLFARPAGGYASFTAAASPANFKCLWSPDSKFVAIFERGTKRSGATTVYSVSAGRVQEVAFPDLMPSIRPHLTAEMRASWVRPEVWLPDHELVLTVQGSQMDEEHANFRFILTLQFSADESGKLTAKMTSFRQDKSVNFSVK